MTHLPHRLRAPMRATSLFLLLAAGAWIGCTPAPVCVPGETQTCVCPGDVSGAQVCNADGEGWGECDCDDDAADAGSSSDGGDTGDGDGDGDTGDGDGDNGDGDGDGDGDTGPEAIPGISILERFVGLWAGPADSSTALGDFQLMSMDARPLDDRTLFARGDLDAANSIRFLFTVETIDGEDVVIYRNGGFFQGVMRDSRTRLETVDVGAGTYRFCAIAGGFCDPNPGCDYIDAIWQFDGDSVSLDVTVCGQPHVTWEATRIETRDAPAPFPIDASPTGTGVEPFPPMPSVDVTMTWNDAAEGGERLLLTLSQSACPLNPLEGCALSRTFLVEPAAGETQATFTLEQIHSGDYFVNALLDRDANLFPNTGDFVSVPNASFALDDDQETLDVSVSIPVQF